MIQFVSKWSVCLLYSTSLTVRTHHSCYYHVWFQFITSVRAFIYFFFESKTKIPRQWFLFIYVYVYLHVFINTCYETCILASKSFIVQNLEYYMYFDVFGFPNIHKLPTNHIVKYSHIIFFPFCNCDRRWKNTL